MVSTLWKRETYEGGGSHLGKGDQRNWVLVGKIPK